MIANNVYLRKANYTIKLNEKLTVHSDGGYHYYLPEWIRIMEEASHICIGDIVKGDNRIERLSKIEVGEVV